MGKDRKNVSSGSGKEKDSEEKIKRDLREQQKDRHSFSDYAKAVDRYDALNPKR